MKYTANLSDYAIANIGGLGTQQSIHKGEITMISLKGINIKLEYGTYFVKWCNVKEIIKDDGGLK